MTILTKILKLFNGNKKYYNNDTNTNTALNEIVQTETKNQTLILENLDNLFKKITNVSTLERHPELIGKIDLYTKEIPPEVESQIMDGMPYAVIKHYINEIEKKKDSYSQKYLEIDQDKLDKITELEITKEKYTQEKNNYTQIAKTIKAEIEKRAYKTKILELETTISTLESDIKQFRNKINEDKTQILQKINSLELAKKYPIINSDFLMKTQREKIVVKYREKGANLESEILVELTAELPLFSYTNYFTDQQLTYTINDWGNLCEKEYESQKRKSKLFSKFPKLQKTTIPIQEGTEKGYIHGIIELKSELECIIPIETKIRIEKAKKFFEEEIYLIYEAKTWHKNNYNNITPNPLVVGIKNDETHLIDIFSPQDLESAVNISYNHDTN